MLQTYQLGYERQRLQQQLEKNLLESEDLVTELPDDSR